VVGDDQEKTASVWFGSDIHDTVSEGLSSFGKIPPSGISVKSVGLTRFAGAVRHRQRWPRESKCATIEELGRHHARNRIVRQSLSAILVDRLSQPRVATDTQHCLQRFDSAANLNKQNPC
jgi:hypothetical protein